MRFKELTRIVPGLPDFYWYNVPKQGKILQMTTKLPNAHKYNQ
jgi:hypothetical protein